MNRNSICKAIWMILVSIILTSATAFGKAYPISREAYVRPVFEEFHSTLFFLSGNDRFLNSLTPEERIQFELVAREIVKTVAILGPLPRPGDNRTSKKVNFKLRFSDKNEDFILTPGGKVRTAKMDGDVWFNLNVINNPDVSFGLLDAFQIMFHEFGHKLVEGKNQDLIDKVAAKIRLEMANWYKEAVLNGTTKVSSLAIPYLSFERHPIDLQFEPIVIIDHQGQAVEARFDAIQSQLSAVGYTINPNRAQAYMRTTFVPKVSLLDKDQIKIEWQVSHRNSFVVSDKYRYLDLYTNIDKAKASEKLPPIMEFMKLTHRVSTEDLQRIARKEFHEKQMDLKPSKRDYQVYQPANDKSRWLEKIKMSQRTDERLEYTTVIESADPVRTVLLAASMGENAYKLKGEAVALGNNIYQLKFSIPATTAQDAALSLHAVVLNDQERWDFEDVVKVPLRKIASPKSLSPTAIMTLDSKNQWHGLHVLGDRSLDAQEITWRFGFIAPQTRIEQIEIIWLKSEKVDKDGINYANVVKRIVEVIPREELIQQVINGVLVVEAKSSRASELVKTMMTSEGYVVQDGLFRSLAEFQITDQNYNTFRAGKFEMPSGWRSDFELKPKAASTINRCQHIF